MDFVMKPTNPVVFRRGTAKVLDEICETVRDGYMYGISDCDATETFPPGQLSPVLSCDCGDTCRALATFTRKVVEECTSQSHLFEELAYVFRDTEHIIQHIVHRLQEESRLMRIPSPRANAVICCHRALGSSTVHLMKLFGYPETTLEGILRRNAGFIDYMVEKLGEDYDKMSQVLWENLDALWKLWTKGRLHEVDPLARRGAA